MVGRHYLGLRASYLSLPSFNVSPLLLLFLLLIDYHWLGRVGGFGLGGRDWGVLFLLPLLLHLLLLDKLLLFVAVLLLLLKVLQVIL